jgi:hypothetical protein
MVRGSQVLPPSNVSKRVCLVPNKKPWLGSDPVNPMSRRTMAASMGRSMSSQSSERRRFAWAAGTEIPPREAVALRSAPAPNKPRRANASGALSSGELWHLIDDLDARDGRLLALLGWEKAVMPIKEKMLSKKGILKVSGILE